MAYQDIQNFQAISEAQSGNKFSEDERKILKYVVDNKNVTASGGSYNYKAITIEYNLLARYNMWRVDTLGVHRTGKLSLFIRTADQLENRIKNDKKIESNKKKK